MPSDDELYDLVIQWDQRRQQGEEVPAAALCTDCPELIPALEERIASVKATDWLLGTDDEDDDFLSLPPQLTGKAFSVPQSVSLEKFRESIVVSGLLTTEDLQREQADSANDLAGKLIRSRQLTEYQAKQICDGNTKGLVLGNYVILDKIGAGGMGQVFKARHKRMKRIVALKTLPEKAVDSPAALERFHREVEAAARLEHPNIVTAHDADEFDGQHFLVMQHVDGNDLSSLVRRKGPMSVGHAVDCIIQVAKALEYAHGEGVIHRDIKPGNLLLDKRGVVKVLDMGLARLVKATGAGGFAITESELTAGGAVLGTVDYLAPEQALDTHSADGRSDIYSLGCTFHFLLTGKPVFGGSTLMAKMLAHREKQIPSLRDEREDVPERLQAIYEKMVAKKPADRYPSMTALLADLEPAAAQWGDTWKQEQVYKSRPVVESETDSQSRETSSWELSDTEVVSPQVEPDHAIEVLAEKPPSSGRRIFAGSVCVFLLAGIAYWLSGIVFKVETPDGIIQIESNVMEVDVFVDNEKVVHITDPNDKKRISVKIPAGAKLLRVRKEGFEADVSEFKLNTVEGPIRLSFVPVEKGNTIGPPMLEGADRERQVAEWVLLSGGQARLKSGDWIHEAGKLPDSPFEVTGVFITSPNFTGEAFRSVCNLPNLSHLWAENCPITDKDLVHLGQAKNLEYLNLRGTSVADIGPIEGLSKLKELLLGSDLRDDVLEHVGKLKELRSLQMNLSIHSRAITDAGLTHLVGLRNLEHLDLSAVGITDDGTVHISSLPNLSTLSLHGFRTGLLTDTGLANLASMQSLRELFLIEWSVTDEGLEKVARLDELVKLILSGCQGISDAGLAHVKKMQTLDFLDLTRTQVTADGIAELRKALPNCEINWDGSEVK